jgi:hypothetical protein
MKIIVVTLDSHVDQVHLPEKEVRKYFNIEDPVVLPVLSVSRRYFDYLISRLGDSVRSDDGFHKLLLLTEDLC